MKGRLCVNCDEQLELMTLQRKLTLRLRGESFRLRPRRCFRVPPENHPGLGPSAVLPGSPFDRSFCEITKPGSPSAARAPRTHRPTMDELIAQGPGCAQGGCRDLWPAAWRNELYCRRPALPSASLRGQ